MEERYGTYLNHLRSLAFINEIECIEAAPQKLIMKTVKGYCFEIALIVYSSHLTKANAQSIVLKIQTNGAPTILFAPYIGGPLGEYFAEHAVNYIDKHGNCHLRLGDDYYVHLQGKRDTSISTQHKQPSLRYAGYTALYSLLIDSDLVSKPLRTIADRAGVSRQAVATLLGKLESQALIVKNAQGKYIWVPHKRHMAFEWWLFGYQEFVRPKLYRGSYMAPENDPEQFFNRAKAILSEKVDAWCIGGHTAAYLQNNYYKGNQVALYLHKLTPGLQRELKLQKHSHGTIFLFQLVSLASLSKKTQFVTEPLLTYAEMLSDPNERSIEAAEKFREEYVDAIL